MPFLSIIVPIYKVEEYLPECIDSIITQTFSDLEIILVDDGGTDNCPDICDAYAKRDKRIKVIHKENGGLVSARKAGMKAATGEYAAFVDGDDSIAQGMYETMCKAALQTDADIVIEGFEFVYPDRVELWHDNVCDGEYDKGGLIQNIYPVMMCHDNSLDRNIAPALWNKIFRRELLGSILSGMNEGIRDGEDAAVTYPCLFAAEKVVFMTSEHYYRYRINTISMSRSFDKTWYESASAYCVWMNDKFGNADSYLKESVNLENFKMLYRYVNREYAFCKKNKEENFHKRMKKIIEETAVGKSIWKVDLKNLRLPFLDKLKYAALRHKMYTFCKVLCWLEYSYGRMHPKSDAH